MLQRDSEHRIIFFSKLSVDAKNSQKFCGNFRLNIDYEKDGGESNPRSGKEFKMSQKDNLKGRLSWYKHSDVEKRRIYQG